MSVLTLAGKKINWDKPPKPTDMVMWSSKTVSGRSVIGSLRAIAHLDHLNALSLKKYNKPVSVLQPPFNTGVAASEGSHDFDQTFDVWIEGVSGSEQQRFIRANGGGAYLRVPPMFPLHIHFFTLPERQGADVSDDYRSGGFRVGRYVDGGWSTVGARVTSSQIEDYYAHDNALEGHAHDPSWFPEDIDASLFDLPAYIARQRGPKRLTVQTTNIEDKVAPPLAPSLTTIKPHVAVLQQAGSATKYLSARRGYGLRQFARGPEAREVKALVRDGVKVRRVRRLTMRLSWIGPKTARIHGARVYQAIKILTPFRAWTINVHFPTGGPDGPNADAWMESWRRVERFLSKRRGVAIGDFNATADELAPLCRKAGFVLTSFGKVDHAVSNRLRRVSKQPLPGKPADVHGWGAVTYEPIKKETNR